MTARARDLPGAWLVLALLAAGVVTTTWLWAGRVPIESAGAEQSPRPLTRIDVNRAGAAELQMLPGIGPALAGRIVADRDANGPFASIEDLSRVPGVGPATVTRIAPMAVTSGVTSGLHQENDPPVEE